MSYLFRTVVNPLLEYTILSDTRCTLGTKVVAEAIFQKCDDSNANGHKFPKKVLAKAIADVKKDVESRHFLGELDHPEDINDINRIATISLKNVSHVITELKMDDNYVVGRFETLDTPSGVILSALLKDRIKLGVSIRALTEQDISYGLQNVDTINSFNMISYDAVHNPAYSDAYVTSIVGSVFKIGKSLSENKISVNENGSLLVERPKLITMTREELADLLQTVIESTIDKLHKCKK